MKMLFQYKCPVCEHEQESLQERTANPPECHLCGAETEKMISTPAFTFKVGHSKGTTGGHTMRIAGKKK